MGFPPQLTICQKSQAMTWPRRSVSLGGGNSAAAAADASLPAAGALHSSRYISAAPLSMMGCPPAS
jgi:hypothetical protein